MSSDKRTRLFLWIAFFIVEISVILNLAWDAAGRISPVPYNVCIGLIFTMFCFFHGRRYFAAFPVLALLFVSIPVTFVAEYAGVKTGMLFGAYHYGNVLGPLVLDTVPYLVPMSWFMLMYGGTVITNEAMGWTGEKYLGEPGRKAVAVVAFALVDSFLMTALDMLIDPIWVSRGTWIWTEIGNLSPGHLYYNIPVHNYFGWLATSFAVFLPFRAVFFSRASVPNRDRLYLMPAVIYLSIVLVGYMESWLMLSNTGIVFTVLAATCPLFCIALNRYFAFNKEGKIKNNDRKKF
jgi:uncharacterized membrane protein